MASGKRQWVRRLRPPWTTALTTDAVSPTAEAAPMSAAVTPTEKSDHVCGGVNNQEDGSWDCG